MADEVEKLAGNLGDLNRVTLQAGIEFKGFTKRLIEYSDATSKAGKKWTIFARLVSGSPLWRLQNKVRAFVDILGQIEQASVQNAKAAQEQNQRVIDQVQAYQTLAPELEKLNKLKEKDARYALRFAPENKEIREAIKGTLAYNKAILEGISADEAYAKGLDELIKKGKQQTEVFKQAQSVAKFNRDLQTKEGRQNIRGALRSKRKELGAGKTIDKFKGMPRGAPVIGLTAATFSSIYDVFKPNIKMSFSLEKMKEKIAKKSLKMQMGLANFAKSARPVINYLFKVLIMAMLGIVGFLILAKFIKDSLEILHEIGVLDEIMSIGKLVLENVMLIFSMIGALLTGDVYTFLDYALEFVDNLLLIGIGLLKVIIGTAIGLAISVFYTVVDGLHRLISGDDPAFRKAVFKVVKKALFIFLAAYVVKQIAIQMLTVAAIYAMPLLIAVAIGAVMAAIIRKALGPLKKLPFFASGGVSSGGMAVVGEGGPELVSLPAGARVHSNAQSKNMMKSNTVNNHVNVTINAKDTSDAELRRIADQVGNMITNKINRSVSSSGFVR